MPTNKPTSFGRKTPSSYGGNEPVLAGFVVALTVFAFAGAAAAMLVHLA